MWQSRQSRRNRQPLVIGDATGITLKSDGEALVAST